MGNPYPQIQIQVPSGNLKKTWTHLQPYGTPTILMLQTEIALHSKRSVFAIHCWGKKKNMANHNSLSYPIVEKVDMIFNGNGYQLSFSDCWAYQRKMDNWVMTCNSLQEDCITYHPVITTPIFGIANWDYFCCFTCLFYLLHSIIICLFLF